MTKLTLKWKIFKFVMITFAIFGLWLFIYAQKESQQSESDYQKVERLSNFYVSSGYVEGYDYDDDVKVLQRIKQRQLDSLNYSETYEYIKTQKTDNEFITKIDNTVKQAKDLKLQEPIPEYLKLDTTKQQTKTKDELNFINLLK